MTKLNSRANSSQPEMRNDDDEIEPNKEANIVPYLNENIVKPISIENIKRGKRERERAGQMCLLLYHCAFIIHVAESI